MVSNFSCVVTVQLVRPPPPAGTIGSASRVLPSNNWKRCDSATVLACVATALDTDSVTGSVFCGPSSVVAPEAGDGLPGVLAFSVGVPSGTAATLPAPGVADGDIGLLLLLQAALAASSATSPS